MKGTHRGQKTEKEISYHPSSAPSPEPNKLGLNKQGREDRQTQGGLFRCRAGYALMRKEKPHLSPAPWGAGARVGLGLQ